MKDKKLLPVIIALIVLMGFVFFMAARERKNGTSSDITATTTVETNSVSEPEAEPAIEPTEPEPVVEAPAPEIDPEPAQSEASDEVSEPTKLPKDEYSGAKYESQAHQAFENYGEYLCPYGIKYHWFKGMISDYEGNGVWHLKVNVTITNAFDATQEAVAEGRVDFIKEEVTEFEFLDTWD